LPQEFIELHGIVGRDVLVCSVRSLYIGRGLIEAVTDAQMITNEAEEKSRI
jgi:ferredoxin-fold anticodon binding domain-containing protein